MQVKRNELKYYISQGDYLKLSHILKNMLQSDKNNQGQNGYFIRSVYFDSIFDSAFYEKLDGVKTRKKYRLRIYSFNDQKVKFEIKNKINNYIMKETAIISRTDAIKMLNKNFEVMLKYNNPTLNKAYIHFKKMQFRPVVMIDYIREAYTWPINNIRITFDKKLSKNSQNLNIFDKSSLNQGVIEEGKVILEVKYDNYLPGWIKKLFETVSFTNNAISKYCLSRLE